MTLLVLASCLTLGLGPTSPLRVEPTSDPRRVEVVAKLPPMLVSQIPAGKLEQEQGETWLRFCLADIGGGVEGPPVLGTYERRQDELRFTPRFPLVRGQRYLVRFEPVKGQAITVEHRVPPPPPSPPALVEKIVPGNEQLPANQLRFYVYFSRPMRGGKDIFDQIHILDADGEPVFDPWLRDELWDSADRVLVLYIHPGRIKWGLLLRLLLGPVLVPDRDYTLIIPTTLLDSDGRPLAKEFRLKFRTTAEDRTRIELSQWKVSSPQAGTQQAVTLSFPKAIDERSLQRFLKVVDAQGKEVAGKIALGKQEKSWSFTPKDAWKEGDYRILVDERLEDTAGNTPAGPFDEDTKKPKPPPQDLRLPFRPTPAAPPTLRGAARPREPARLIPVVGRLTQVIT
jgi:hypothetical protein